VLPSPANSCSFSSLTVLPPSDDVDGSMSTSDSDADVSLRSETVLFSLASIALASVTQSMSLRNSVEVTESRKCSSAALAVSSENDASENSKIQRLYMAHEYSFAISDRLGKQDRYADRTRYGKK